MTRSNPHDGWRLRAVGGPVPDFLAGRDVPAQVPGSTHLDLDYDPAPFTAGVTPVAGGYRVDVRATSYVRDLNLRCANASA